MRQVLCFGDSNTYGYVPGTAERYDWDTRWTGIVGTGLMERDILYRRKGCVAELQYLTIRFVRADVAVNSFRSY